MMDEKLINYLETLYPHLDIHGKYVMLPTTKTAIQSISKGVLNKRTIIVNQKHRRDRRNWQIVWYELFRGRLDDVFMWTFVRNPWDRTLSAFLHVRRRIKKDWRRIKFKDFVKTLLLEYGTSVNSHFHEQTRNFLFNDEFIPGLFIGRFEHLHEDWEYIAEKIGVSDKLPHLNKTKHSHYMDYYDDESRDIVSELYKKEIEVLGYEFGG